MVPATPSKGKTGELKTEADKGERDYIGKWKIQGSIRRGTLRQSYGFILKTLPGSSWRKSVHVRDYPEG